jgi:hypothetical protein
VPGQTQTVAITPNGRTAYVTNVVINGKAGNAEHTTVWVTPVSVATDTAGRAFVGRSVQSTYPSSNISIAPAGKTGYLWGANVTPIDLATNRPEKLIRLDASLAQVVSNFVISPDGQVAYVGGTAKQHRRIVGAVIPIQAASQRIGTPIPVQGSPEQVVIVP